LGYFDLVALNREETILATTGDDQTVTGNDRAVRFWDRATGKMTDSFKYPLARIDWLVLSPDGKLLAATCFNDVTRGDSDFKHGFWLFEVPSGKILASEQTTGATLAFSSDGRLLASEYGRKIRLWSIPAAWRKDK
jgi:WD40 repeat protein